MGCEVGGGYDIIWTTTYGDVQGPFKPTMGLAFLIRDRVLGNGSMEAAPL